MKRTKKGVVPTGLQCFEQAHPAGAWQAFRDDQQGASYQEVRQQVADDQGGLCAYCEVQHNGQIGKFSIEHFQPKSDTSDANKNWALDWQNMLAVCRGGREGDKLLYPTPANLSCDAHKDHLGAHQAIFNPLDMPASKLFAFNKRTGELAVNDELEDDLIELADETLRVLNLNCYRLCVARLEVLKHYNQQIKKAREQKNTAIKQQLAMRWFAECWPSFFTTRRCLLGGAAERYLNSISFDG